MPNGEGWPPFEEGDSIRAVSISIDPGAEDGPPGWCRVSQRGRWHLITGLTEEFAYETGCGRVYASTQAATVAVGDRPGDLCEKCHASRYRLGSLAPPSV